MFTLRLISGIRRLVFRLKGLPVTPTTQEPGKWIRLPDSPHAEFVKGRLYRWEGKILNGDITRALESGRHAEHDDGYVYGACSQFSEWVPEVRE